MGISLQDAQQIFSDQAVRTQYGLILPPGARVAAYVRSIGFQAGDDAFLSTNLVTTLAAGLARVRSGLGDFVVCLPGHVESVADATTFSNALQAGTKIIGVGKGSNTPTFNFITPSTVQWLVNKADVTIAGLRIANVAGGNITQAIQVTAADFGFYYNEVIYGTSTTGMIVAIQLAVGADRADITGNIFRSPLGSGTVVAVAGILDGARICDNEFQGPAPSATGHINVTAAATGLRILRNVMNNGTAASVACIAYSNVACTGSCTDNRITVLSTGAQTGGTTGITVGGVSNLTGYHQNFVVNDPNKSGILEPAADT